MTHLLFSNVQIFDGSGASRFPGEVLVEGARIRAVVRGTDRLPREGAQVVDGGGATLMPGLIESHAHLTFPSAFDRVYPQPMSVGLRIPREQHVLITAHNARTLLAAGYTSAYSGGAIYPAAEVAVRRDIDAGYLPGPRLKTCSVEMDSRSGADEEQGEEALRAFVREMADLGCDSIKLLLSGQDGLPGAPSSQTLMYTEREATAAVQQARELGLWANCHAQASEAVKIAARAGFRVIYHCTFADEEALDLLEARKGEIFVAPAIGLVWANIQAATAANGKPPPPTHPAVVQLERNQALYPKLRARHSGAATWRLRLPAQPARAQRPRPRAVRHAPRLHANRDVGGGHQAGRRDHGPR